MKDSRARYIRTSATSAFVVVTNLLAVPQVRFNIKSISSSHKSYYPFCACSVPLAYLNFKRQSYIHAEVETISGYYLLR